jgi:hypothetical protein
MLSISEHQTESLLELKTLGRVIQCSILAPNLPLCVFEDLDYPRTKVRFTHLQNLQQDFWSIIFPTSSPQTHSLQTIPQTPQEKKLRMELPFFLSVFREFLFQKIAQILFRLSQKLLCIYPL